MSLALPSRNPALDRMRANDVALGMIVRFSRSGEIAQIAKASGHDFVFMDLQHAAFTRETVVEIARAAYGCGISPLVRVRSWNDPETPVLLDGGVTGIIFPDINNADEARGAVAACRFPPLGRRSIAGPYPLFDFRAVPAADSMRHLNENTLVICMIETREGLKNIEEIAAVDGIDVLHIGCNDLLIDMGKPGRLGDPEIIAAIEKLIAVCKAHGKFAGLGGDRDLERQRRFIKAGVRFVTTQTDVGFLLAEASRKVADLRADTAPPAPRT